MNRYFRPIAITFLLAVFLWSPASFATVIFDNGPVDQTRSTWSDAHPITIYDDFVLSLPTEITGLTYSIFMQNIADYITTFVSIFDGIDITSNPVISEFTAMGVLTSNGLTTTSLFVPNGFDVGIDGLSLLLGAGTYYLGISTETAVGFASSIGSGPGSIQTIGPGLFQAFGPSAPLRAEAKLATTTTWRSRSSRKLPPSPNPPPYFCWVLA